ncbi:MAG: zinc ABC transporter substrate-binding protein, partial [Duncaniella sp.]|nr:zinc ABC transporter substrate-binding protein [Duncaniella sp.]
VLSKGANPDKYDPAMPPMINIQKSEAFFRVGNVGFEAALIDKIHDSNPDLPIFDTSRGIDPVRGTHAHHHPRGAVDAVDDELAVDPHTWTSVKNARIMARNMLDALVEIDPEGKGLYTRNYEKFDARLDSLDRAYALRLAPEAGKAFLVWHPSLSYFARDYGLEQVVTGGAEGKDMSATGLREAVENARSHNPRVFFSQKDLDTRQVASLNAEIGAREVLINPMSYDWAAEMDRIVDALAAS